MRYQLTIECQGEYRETVLNLPVTPEIAWHDFVNLTEVKQFLLMNPNFALLDVTPEDCDENTTNTTVNLDIDGLLDDEV